MNITLAKQQGWQGALTLPRDLFVKVTTNVDPASPGVNAKGSWGVKNQTNGSLSIETLGQRVVPEVLKAYKAESKVSTPAAGAVSSAATYDAFLVQPEGRFYVV